MKKCRHCGKPVIEKGMKNCPECGKSIKRGGILETIKGLGALVLGIVFVLGLFGVFDDEAEKLVESDMVQGGDTAAASSDKYVSDGSKKEKTFIPGDTINFSSGEVDYIDSGWFMKEGTGYCYVMLVVDASETDFSVGGEDKSYLVDGDGFKIGDIGGNPPWHPYEGEDLLDNGGTVYKGQKVKGLLFCVCNEFPRYEQVCLKLNDAELVIKGDEIPETQGFVSGFYGSTDNVLFKISMYEEPRKHVVGEWEQTTGLEEKGKIVRKDDGSYLFYIVYGEGDEDNEITSEVRVDSKSDTFEMKYIKWQESNNMDVRRTFYRIYRDTDITEGRFGSDEDAERKANAYGGEVDVSYTEDNDFDEPETSSKDDQYIIKNSDRKYVDENQLKGMSDAELRLARNEIFARHGRKFDAEDLQDYFGSKDWYEPVYEPGEFDATQDSLLNKWEKANVKAILAEEANRKN